MKKVSQPDLVNLDYLNSAHCINEPNAEYGRRLKLYNNSIELKHNFGQISYQKRGTFILNLCNYLVSNNIMGIEELNKFRYEKPLLFKTLKSNEFNAGLNIRLGTNLIGLPPHIYKFELDFLENFWDELKGILKIKNYSNIQIAYIKNELYIRHKFFFSELDSKNLHNYNFNTNNGNLKFFFLDTVLKISKVGGKPRALPIAFNLNV